MTGVKAKALGRAAKSNVCIIGEMDALKCAGSPIADAGDVAHACGHNAQVASMLGAAIGLTKSGVMEELDGSVSFMAVPAEEFIELDYRRKLKAEGRISYFSGKQQPLPFLVSMPTERPLEKRTRSVFILLSPRVVMW